MRLFPATRRASGTSFSQGCERLNKVVFWVQIQVLIDANANLIQKAKANEKKDATAQDQTNIQVALCRCQSPRCMLQRTHELKRARQSWAREVRDAERQRRAWSKRRIGEKEKMMKKMGVDGKRRWAEAAQELDRHPQALPLPRRSIAVRPSVREVKGISKEDAIINSIHRHLGIGRLGDEQTNPCSRAKRTRDGKAQSERERARNRERAKEKQKEEQKN